MATKKKRTEKGTRVKVNKLRVKKDKVEPLTPEDAKQVRGGMLKREPDKIPISKG